jgi:hypothetical protein
LTSALASVAVTAPGSATAAAPAHVEREIIDLTPETPPSWSFRHLTAPVISLFRGPAYMYGERRIEIETTPAHGYVDLFYVRSGFQKRFEQAESPVTVILPSRLEAGPRDAFTVRAFAEGYRQKSVTYRLSDRFDVVNIDLDPLPNRLDAVSHRYFAGRSSLAFLSPEALTFRIQEADDGYAVILNETAMSAGARQAVEELHSPLIAEAYGQQLGEDLMIRLVVAAGGASDETEVRSRQGYDAPRDLHEFVLDFVPAGSAAERVKAALEALAALRTEDVTGCRLVFDETLRRRLDPGALARALRPSGDFTDRYLRAAMRRLGEVSVDGVVDFVDGTRLRPSSPIELEMAISNAAGAKGYLALLDAFVDRLESTAADRAAAFQSLLAPEMASERFAEIVAAARSRAHSCRAAA